MFSGDALKLCCLSCGSAGCVADLVVETEKQHLAGDIDIAHIRRLPKMLTLSEKLATSIRQYSGVMFQSFNCFFMHLLVLTRSNSRSAAPVVMARLLASEMARQGVTIDFRYLTERDTASLGEEAWSSDALRSLVPGDVVHTHGLMPDLKMALYRLCGRIRPGVLWLSTVHCDIQKDMADLVGVRLGNWVTRLWLAALRRADRVVFLSEAARASAGFDERSAVVITNGLPVDIPDVLSEPPSSLIEWLRQRPVGQTVLATFAAPRPLKGIDLMLRAVASRPDLCFFHAGDGPELAGLKRLSEDLGINDRCLFLGFVPDAMRLLSYCDIYLNCSSSEGSPLSVLEALRAGVPVVAPCIPPFAEFLNVSQFHLYQPGQVEDLLCCISETRKSLDSASKMSRQIFLEKFTLTQVTESYLAICVSDIDLA